MEIYLRMEDDRARHLGDLAVRVAPSHTVGDVADAIGRHLRCRTGSEVTISVPRLGPLVRDRPIVETGILSGDTLILGTVWPRPDRSAAAAMLVVASGPDAGRSLRLESGARVVGRDRSCDLVLGDPQVSRRHLRFAVQGDAVTVETLATGRNEVRIDGRPLTGPTAVRPEQVIRIGAGSLVVRSRPSPRHVGVDLFGQVPFHRAPYFAEPVQPVVIDAVGDVPSRPEKSRFGYLSAVLPLLMGISFAVLFGNPRYLVFAAFSPVMVAGNHVEQRRRSGKKFAQSVARFDETLASRTAEVAAALAEERRRRCKATPDVALLNERARSRSIDLWGRDRSGPGFLALRLGLGDLPTEVDVVADTGGDADYRDRIVAAHGVTGTIADVPVTVELAELGVVGLVGRADQTSPCAASLAVQAATLHSPEDLVIVAALAPARAIIDWLKWAPHTRSSSSPLDGPHLVQSRVEADALVGELVKEGIRRLAAGGDGGGSPWLLILLDQAIDPDAAAVSRLLDLCSRAAMSVLWLADLPALVPRQARAVVSCRSPLTGRPSLLSFTDPQRPDLPLDIERVGHEFAAETVRALAPLRDASSTNAATALPRVVPLFGAFGIESIDGDWVARQWMTDRGHALVAPIGCTEAGPLLLDLVEHGPHGLIGGTSGAGKSELVMSIVAGLIAYNPPTRINLLFIDYKGGASSDLFKDVPHTVGYVTNLDGLLARRALTSLRAELNRRMNLLQGRAKDLAEMIDKRPELAPPSLVIVVDEFATLVKEIPDFVAGIVDIAQRGRSLGIHLLLATQRPSGAVDDNIKANTNLRISLRMLDGGESSSVIGTTDAAAIPAPLKGRGFARMGPGEPVAFQSAWAGAPLLAESGPPPVGLTAFGSPARSAAPVGRAGGHGLGTTPVESSDASPAVTDSTRTHLDALLGAVTEATDRLGHRPGPAPWLEVLPSAIPIDAVRAAAAAGADRPQLAPGGRIVFGMIDDPAAQAQYPAVLDLATSGGLIVSGAGGSGKSTLLETLAVSAALDDHELGGGRLTIFALDFASRQLGGLRRLPQCGAVATGDDLEAVTRVVSLLHTELERRRRVMADAVTRSEAATHSTVLLLIDGLDALIQTMEQGPAAAGLARSYADLTRIVAEGRHVGIHPVISATRRATVRAAMTAAVSDRLTLRQVDAQGYAECGIGAVDAKDLDLAPGQGLLNGPTLVQVATLTGPPPAGPEDRSGSGDDRQRLERRRLADLAATLAGRVDPRLVTAPLPATVGLCPSGDAERPVIGIADLTGQPFSLDLRHNDVSVIGDPRSGRSTALATIGRQVAAAGAEVWVLAGPSSPLAALTEATMSCFDDGDRRLAFVAELIERAGTPIERSTSRLFLLDDHDLLPEHDHSLVAAVERLLGLVRYVATGSKPRGFSSNPILHQIRGCRSLVHLRPNDARDAHEVVGIPVPWHPGLPMVEGRGYVVVDRLATMVQFSDPFLHR